MCVDDDDITTLPEYEYISETESTTGTCFDIVIGDGDCDPINNNEECGGFCGLANSSLLPVAIMFVFVGSAWFHDTVYKHYLQIGWSLLR